MSQRVSAVSFVVVVVVQTDIAVAAELCNRNQASGSQSAADPVNVALESFNIWETFFTILRSRNFVVALQVCL